MAQNWSAVKGILWWSHIWLSKASALLVSCFQNDIAVLHINTYSVAILFHYINATLTGWYLKLVSGSAISTSQERTQSQTSKGYQVCLQSISFSVHQYCCWSVYLKMHFDTQVIKDRWRLKRSHSFIEMLFKLLVYNFVKGKVNMKRLII